LVFENDYLAGAAHKAASVYLVVKSPDWYFYSHRGIPAQNYYSLYSQFAHRKF
jgi:hypothetical protein